MGKNSFAHRLKVVLPISIFVSFTAFFFGPLELFLTNTAEFWFSLKDIIFGVVLTFLCCLILITILLLISVKNGQGFICAVVWGLGVATYVQGNFMPISYGVLDGRTIEWGKYTNWGIANTIIWIAIVLMATLLCRHKTLLYNKVSHFVSYLAVAMQMITLIVLLVTAKPVASTNYFLSTDGILSLSSHENIVVLLLDGYESSVAEHVLEQEPVLADTFKDFTFFNNALCSHPTTRGSVSRLLTGESYRNLEPWQQYIDEAYQKTPVYKELYIENYDIGIYTEYPGFVSPSQSNIISNVRLQNYQVQSYLKLNRLLYQFTAFRYMPHFLKQYFWIYSGIFSEVILTENAGGSPYVTDDVAFYNNLASNKMSLIDKNAFRFIHLNGAHGPYNMNEKMERIDSQEGNEINQATGAFNIVAEYLDQMKDLGVYDDSMIIVLADHGYMGLRQNPLFMIKRADDKKSNITVNAAPISWDEFLPTILSRVSSKYADYGKTVFEIPENQKRERVFLQVFMEANSSSDYMSDMTEYISYGNARDVSQMKKTGRVFTNHGIEEFDTFDCEFGLPILFSQGGEAQRLFNYGLCISEGESAWSSGAESEFEISVEDNLKDLIMSFKFSVFQGKSGTQRMSIFVNNKFLEERSFVVGDTGASFQIPKNFLNYGTQTIRIQYPDAIAPKSIGMNDDNRILAFAYTSLVFEQVR